MSNNFNGKIQIRLPAADLLEFENRCVEMKRPYQNVLREMIVAFNESRLKINPTDQQRELYVD